MATITVHDVEFHIIGFDGQHSHPVAVLDGEPVGGFLGCWGEGEPFLMLRDVSNFPDCVTLTAEQQQIVMHVYRTETLPAVAESNRRYTPSAEERREWIDDQYNH